MNIVLLAALAVGAAHAADPWDLRDSCVEGEAEACQALMPAQSEQWAWLDAACVGGMARSCLALAHASADDRAARDPVGAATWVQAACDAGDSASCARLPSSTPTVYISGEGIAVNGTVQVRFSGGTRWALADGSTDGQLIKPAYGALRALAREHRVGEPGALPATLELRADPRAPSDIVRDLLYTAGQAGWRSFAIGAANDLSEQLQPVWLPSLGSATTTHSVLQAAAAARPTGLVILGSVDPAQLNKALRQPPAGMTRCWERAVRQDPNQGGRLELRIVIGSDGGVNDAAIAMSELDNPSLEACILEAFEDADFPRPSGHGIAIIEYPMVLEPVWAEEN